MIGGYLHAGMLRERIIVEQPEYQLDMLGGAVTSWQPHSILWAHVESVRGSEKAFADSRRSVVTKKVMIRANDAISSDMRMIIDGAPHVIDAVMPHKKQPEFYECLVRLGSEL